MQDAINIMGYQLHAKLCMTALITFGLGLAASETLYILPSPTDPCPAEHCFVLSLNATEIDNYMYPDSSTEMIFLPGLHVLNTIFSVRDINISLTLMSSGFHLSEDRPFILCEQVANFAFANVTRVTISGIDLVNCSEYRIEFVPKFEVENSGFFNIENIQGTALKLITTTVSITNSSFFYFTGSSNHEGSFIGGAMILTQSNVSIQNCQFEGNQAEFGGAIFANQGSNIIITDGLFLNNHVACADVDQLCIGGVLYLENNSTAVILQTMFGNNKAIYNDTSLQYIYSSASGGVLGINGSIVSIEDSYFAYNWACLLYTSDAADE